MSVGQMKALVARVTNAIPTKLSGNEADLLLKGPGASESLNTAIESAVETALQEIKLEDKFKHWNHFSFRPNRSAPSDTPLFWYDFERAGGTYVQPLTPFREELVMRRDQLDRNTLYRVEVVGTKEGGTVTTDDCLALARKHGGFAADPYTLAMIWTKENDQFPIDAAVMSFSQHGCTHMEILRQRSDPEWKIDFFHSDRIHFDRRSFLLLTNKM